jgi:hypothetical protein
LIRQQSIGLTRLLNRPVSWVTRVFNQKEPEPVQNVNLIRLEEEMRQFAEERIQTIAGDAPMLTTTQLAEIWGRSPSWIAKMRAAGRIPNIQFGDWPQVPRAVAIMGLVKGV